MALLGLFSKRDKHKSPGSASSTAAPKSSNGSVAGSSEDHHSFPDAPHTQALPHHVYGNPEASSSKFHLGFHRKKSTLASEVTDSPLLRPPQQPFLSSSRSEADMDDIRPPPTKASLFSAYGDPHNALSTRSLPNERSTNATLSPNVAAATSNSTDHLPPRRSTDGRRSTDVLRQGTFDTQPAQKKPTGGGLFSWAHRERKKSKVAEDAPELPPLDTSVAPPLPRTDDSFNLKSFRHIRPEAESPVADSSLLVPPARPRPRGDSTTSDTSQRISVAAFREMAARRSAAGSPTSSPVLLRPPSRTDSLEHSPFQRSPASSFQRSPASAIRSSSLAVSSGSTSSESDDSGDSESDESPQRQRTITQKSAADKASSDMGHTIRAQELTPSRSAQSVSASGHSESPSEGPRSSQAPKVGGSSVPYRPRASVSTSAMQPNAAAKRASLLASTQPPVPLLSDRAREKARAHDSDSDDDSRSSSEDSDDAPLASFMRPSRPGSSASNTTSASRSRIPPKPLIDITKMTTPSLPPLPAPGDQSQLPKKEKVPTPPEKDRQPQTLRSVEKEASRSPPSHSEKPSISDRLARIAQTAGATSVEKLADTQPLERRSLDARRPLMSEDPSSVPRGRLPKQPTRSQTAPMASLDSSLSTVSTSTSSSTSTSTPPTTRPHTKPRSFSSSSPNPAAAYDLTDPTPIVPTPIRQRSPPPAFSVTSRPASQLSLNGNPRLSLTQSTVRIVDSSSTSSSPTTPNTPWTTSPEMLPVTTASFQKQIHGQPPLGHFSSSSPAAQPSPKPSTASPAPASGGSSFSSTTAKPLPSSPASSNNSPVPSRPSPQSRPRSSTLIPHNGIPPSEGFTGGGLLASRAANSSSNTSNAKGGDREVSAPAAALRTARQRSSTLLPQMEVSSTSVSVSKLAPRRLVDPGSTNTSSSGSSSGPAAPLSRSSASNARAQAQAQIQNASAQAHRFPQRPRAPFDASAPTPRSAPSPINLPPERPFARPERRNSPASSTGDSSSGRTPLTPADGSDYGYPESKSVVSAMAGNRKGQRPRANVSFEDEDKDKGKLGTKSGDADEERRKERRRSEAKAAIELGKVVNGRITLEAEDEDQLAPLNTMGPRMNMVNPMMSFTPPTPMINTWQQPVASPTMLNPQQFMVPPNADPRFFAAHQHAMMVAKQAYQMAVAQQALAAANEEWERGSAVSAVSGMGMSMPTMGMSGMGMPGMGMGAPMGGMLPGGYGMQWTNPGSMMFPSSASMYAGSMLGSELGVNSGWGTQSEYGGPARANRTSAMFNARPPAAAMSSARSEYGGPAGHSSKAPTTRPRNKTAPSSAPTPHHRTGQAPPPSSWKPTGR